jgi:hypothetical protein
MRNQKHIGRSGSKPIGLRNAHYPYGRVDQIAAEIYVICTLPGEVTYKPTLQAKGWFTSAVGTALGYWERQPYAQERNLCVPFFHSTPQSSSLIDGFLRSFLNRSLVGCGFFSNLLRR